MEEIKKIFVVIHNNTNKEIDDLPVRNISGFFTSYDEAVSFIDKIDNINKRQNINNKDDFIQMDIDYDYDIWCIRNEKEILKENLIQLEENKNKTGYENVKNIFNMLLNS